ncbi:RNA polymerase factor sigma-54 [Pseudoblastomonas halimionae]|uniref:RNA polymerase sigma-54 factor n=1 Tax=Alteriqipengyuania halimionae TaxID=1926630 RepID=A0A6I4U515_9SPHN|nr:RNA polymerase factor sigma-54 [Alteriqipengyuania halimionae]MXP11068.1 RNA polymerase factor sigma-54 [Alteriqipengyuania halimionae]
MSLGPRLDLRQSQSLVMTPQLQQAIKLLALSNLEIETFVGDALESNPLLDVGDQRREADSGEDAPAPEEHHADAMDGDSGALDIDESALDRDHDTGDWSAASGSAAGADDLPGLENESGDGPTLAEHLHAQIGPVAADERQALLAHAIVDAIDEAGYLSIKLREVAELLGVGESEAEQALELVQTLDPTGVGARSLSECLALQAREADRYDPCMARLIDHLDWLARGDFTRLRKLCNVDEDDFSDMLAELRRYDPKPGLQYGGGASAPVVPDVLLAPSDEGGWKIRINRDTLPRLVVNRDYFLELKQDCSDKHSRGWLSEKLADAKWLIKALDQRQKTILKVARAIVKAQDGFFRRGVSELKPLTLRTVAEEIEMHESTVSRVTSNKYLHCPRGTFELKYFFSSGVSSSDGEGASAEAVKAAIRGLTDAEDPKKILSDDALVALLKERGFDVARRTVAKYREAAGIGSSVQRRRAKKLAGR